MMTEFLFLGELTL